MAKVFYVVNVFDFENDDSFSLMFNTKEAAVYEARKYELLGYFVERINF